LDVLYRKLESFSKEKDEYKDEIENLERKIDRVMKRDSSLSIYNIGFYEIGARKIFSWKSIRHTELMLHFVFLTIKIVNYIRNIFNPFRGL
jgi:hypothetical protein